MPHASPIVVHSTWFSLISSAVVRGIYACAAVFAVIIGAPVPAAADSDRVVGFENRTFAVTGATVVVRPGTEIRNGVLIIRNGLIAAAGTAEEVAVPADAVVVKADGLYVYAGFIDAGTSNWIDGERVPKPKEGRKVDFSRYVLAATRPDNRRNLTPEFEARDALKLEDKELEAARKAGFTAVHVVPSGRIASGRGVLLTTGDEPLRESTLLPRTFCEFQLFAPGGDKYPATLMGATAHLRQAFLDAEHFSLHRKLYRQGEKFVPRPPEDETLSQLKRVLAGDDAALFKVDERDDVERALNFAEEHKLSAALWGARDAYRMVDRLKRDKVDVVLRTDYGDEPKIEPPATDGKLVAKAKKPLRAQKAERDRWKDRLAGPAALNKAGVRFAFSSDGLKNRADVFKALRRTIQHGLPRDAALAAVTTDAAAILSIGDRLGALSPGMLGHAVVTTGPFDNEKSKVRYVFVDGRKYEYNEESKPVDVKTTDDAPTINLAGTWSVDVGTGDDKTEATLKLTHEKDMLAGAFESEHGNGRLKSGSFKNNAVDFIVAIGAGDRTLELKFTGMYAEGKLSGKLKPAFGASTPWTAERVETSEPKNPVELAKIETDDDPKKKDGKTIATDLPTETDADRRRRPIQTGGNIIVRNATVLTGTGTTLENASILIKDGKFAAIGDDVETPEGFIEIDATGRFVIPGIIDTHSHIMAKGGLNEYTQSIVPEVRVKDVVRTDDVAEYRALAGGTTAARIFHGSANVIGGQDAVVKFKHGAGIREHILDDAPQGVKFALGENVKFRTTRFPNTRLGVEATLNRAFMEAIDYRNRRREFKRVSKEKGADALLPPRRDLRLEALADIVDHKKFIHSHCYRADEILMLLRTASNLGIRVWSLQHVLEGYKIAPEIAAHGASCSTFSDWWAYKVEAFDATPYNAALLQEAGVNVVIKSDDNELIRHLNLEAAKTVRYGGKGVDDALATVTINAARELGLDDRMGSIEVGKDADLAIFSGHPFDAFSRCETTIVDGEVCFSRKYAPTAMSAEAVKRIPAARVFNRPSSEVRERKLDLEPADSHRYAITGGTVHPVDVPPIENGVLVIDDGKITAVGSAGEVTIPEGAKILDAGGMHVTPGFIDAGTTLGLVEIKKVRETHDYSEGGLLQPDLRAGVAVNPDSELIPAARAGGVTAALIHPTGGVIAGQASLIKLAGWTAPEMVVNLEAGLRINWPTGKTREEHTKALKEFLEQARQYNRIRTEAEKAQQPGPIVDPRLEALSPYVNGERPVFIEAESRRSIAEALLFAEEEKLKIVITGGVGAWKLADELKKRNVPVIVGPVMRSPIADYDPHDAPYANAGRLYEAGVKFCIRSDNASNSRNAPFEAAMAVAFGLPEDEGLRAVTLSAAEILGVGDSMGSLTPGKLANVVISDGPPLQHTSRIKAVFVDGTPHKPESRQTRFYERYRGRLLEHVKGRENNVTGG